MNGVTICEWMIDTISDWVVTHFALFFPAGSIAEAEGRLIIVVFLLMLIVVVPVFILTAYFAWHYRESNTKATYTPKWDTSIPHEVVWWSVPVAIVFVLSIIAWNAAHDLDPYKAIESPNEPVVIQTISLRWKWLFIYPSERIATVNSITIPENTPVIFRITSDAPMNSFWMPEIAGMIMNMPGMITELNVIVPERGTYVGMSSNYSGEGFAGMDFKIHVVSREAYQSWAKMTQMSGQALDFHKYQKLAEPSKKVPAEHYRLAARKLFRYVVMKYMMPGIDSPKDLHGEGDMKLPVRSGGEMKMEEKRQEPGTSQEAEAPMGGMIMQVPIMKMKP